MFLVDLIKKLGGMVVVGFGCKEVELYFSSGVLIGCENSFESIIFIGDKDVLEGVMLNIKEVNLDILVWVLQVDWVYYFCE